MLLSSNQSLAKQATGQSAPRLSAHIFSNALFVSKKEQILKLEIVVLMICEQAHQQLILAFI